MAHDYKKVRIRQFAQLEEHETPESRYWRKFRHPTIVKEPAPVTSIDFCAVAPHDYAVTTGSRVAVYDGKSNKEKRLLSKFKDDVYSGHFRSDGKLVVVGSARSVVQVVEVKSRTALRTYKGHTGAVHTTRFAPDNVHVFSAGDDRSIRFWDMPSAAAVSTVENAHDDYIRCCAVSGSGAGAGAGAGAGGGAGGGAASGAAASGSQLWATGSYDHTVKLWDMRSLIGGSGSGGSSTGSGAMAGDNDDDEDEEEGEEQGAGGSDEDDDDDADENGESSDDDSGGMSDAEDGSEDDRSGDNDDDDEVEDEEAEGGSGGAAATATDDAPRAFSSLRHSAGASTSFGRRDGSILSVDHGEPVTQVSILPGGGTLLTAGGSTVKLWDILAGGRCVHSFSHHQKLITAMTLDGTATRLLTGGLDGAVKVHELATFTVTHQMRYAAPILSLAVAPDNSRLVVGCTDGTLHVKQRVMRMGEALLEAREARVLRSGSYRYFLRGRGSTATGEDVTAEAGKKPKLKEYDKKLKEFQHAAALDAAMATRSAPVICSVLEELIARNAVTVALSGRSEESVEGLVAFLCRYMAHPRYSALLLEVASLLLDLYAPRLGSSYALDAAFARLQGKLAEEVRVDRELLSLQGMLDLLMAASTSNAGGAGMAADAAEV